MSSKRKLLENVRLNYKDIGLIVAWFMVDSLKPQNVHATNIYISMVSVIYSSWYVVILHRAEAQSLQEHSTLIDLRVIYPIILAYALYTAGTPRTPDTTDTEEEGIKYDVTIDNYISAKMVEVLAQMNSLT